MREGNYHYYNTKLDQMMMVIMKENREFKVDKIVVMVIDARTFNSQLDRDVCVCITFHHLFVICLLKIYY